MRTNFWMADVCSFEFRDAYNHFYEPMQDIISSIVTERLIHRFCPVLRFDLI